MEKNIPNKKAEEQRLESRMKADRYESVEFRTSESDTLYQFALFDVSAKGLCFVVNEDSTLLKELKVGDVLKMKYYPPPSSGGAEYLMTEIKHITKTDQEKFEGRCFFGLSIFEKETGSVFMPSS